MYTFCNEEVFEEIWLVCSNEVGLGKCVSFFCPVFFQPLHDLVLHLLNVPKYLGVIEIKIKIPWNCFSIKE